MILEREQINRYLRHIIMPEISGTGQKKLLESSVFIYGEDVKDTAPAVYYLAASGVGSIYCCFDNAEGFDELRSNAMDLNSDIIIEMAEIKYTDVRIILGGPEFTAQNYKRVSSHIGPTIVCIYNGWKGAMSVFSDAEQLDSFFADAAPAFAESGKRALTDDILSSSVMGALLSMEVMKICTGVGETAEDLLYYNLLTLEFLNAGKTKLHYALNELLNTDGQQIPREILRNKKVLIAGTGGLGSPAAYALTLSGIGTIGLVDYDVVEISNLNRQILHSTSRIGKYKAESAETFLKRLRPDINISIYNTSINKENVYELIKEYDVVINAVDNFPTRFLINDACYFAGKPLIDAGVLRFDGTCTAFIPKEGPCYRCMLSDIPAPGSVPSCSEAGVLGPVPGIMGFIQASEAVKLLTGIGILSKGKIIIFDGLYSEFRTVVLDRQGKCPLCGENPTIHELQNYEFSCRKDDN